MSGELDKLKRDELIMQWQAAANALANAKELEMNLRNQVVAECFPNATVGVNNLELGMGYKLKATRKLNYNVNNEGVDAALDDIAKIGNDGAFIAERLVSFKPTLSVSEYKKLDATNPTHKRIKDRIDEVLTTSDGAPTLELVEPKKK